VFWIEAACMFMRCTLNYSSFLSTFLVAAFNYGNQDLVDICIIIMVSHTSCSSQVCGNFELY